MSNIHSFKKILWKSPTNRHNRNYIPYNPDTFLPQASSISHVTTHRKRIFPFIANGIDTVFKIIDFNLPVMP